MQGILCAGFGRRRRQDCRAVGWPARMAARELSQSSGAIAGDTWAPHSKPDQHSHQVLHLGAPHCLHLSASFSVLGAGARDALPSGAQQARGMEQLVHQVLQLSMANWQGTGAKPPSSSSQNQSQMEAVAESSAAWYPTGWGLINGDWENWSIQITTWWWYWCKVLVNGQQNSLEVGWHYFESCAACKKS